MPATERINNTASLEAKIHALETRLSPEQCELLKQIRSIRKTIGPVTQNVGTLLNELNETKAPQN